MDMKWDAYVGTSTKRVMEIKWLVDLERPFRLVIDLHRIVNVDPKRCYHGHPYDAIRIPLWGGYIEELEDGTKRVIWPGRIGIVRTKYFHRIDSFLFGSFSLSLWIHGKSVCPVEIHGDGWADAEDVSYHYLEPKE